jgi:hypothetical protein
MARRVPGGHFVTPRVELRTHPLRHLDLDAPTIVLAGHLADGRMARHAWIGGHVGLDQRDQRLVVVSSWRHRSRSQRFSQRVQ